MIKKGNNIRAANFISSGKKSVLFQGLDEQALQQVLNNATLKNYKAGQTLVQQGDQPIHMYFIVEGCIKTVRKNADGEETTIHMLEAGDTCMDSVIFMGGPSPIDVQVTENARVMQISANFVKKFVLQEQQFAANLLKIVAQHYKKTMHQIDAMSIKKPVQRVGYYFLQKHVAQGANNMEFELPFRKSTIANHLGMAPETFSRALKQIKKMGIEVEGEKIRMKEAYALCHFCDLDTAHECTLSSKENCPLCPIHNQNWS